MTVMAAPEARWASEADLCEVIAGGDDQERAAAISELDRRDRAAKARTRARSRYAGWEDAARANFAAAEVYCRGDLNMVNPAGRARGVGPWELWRGAEDLARRWASPELVTFWDYVQPRPPGPAAYAAASSARREDTREGETNMVGFGTPSPGGGVNGGGSAVNGPAAGSREDHAARAAARQVRMAALSAEAAGLAGSTSSRPPAGEVATVEAGEVISPEASSVTAPRSPQFMRRAERVDGADVLRQAYAFAECCARWPNPDALATAAVWAAKSHGKAKATDPDIEGSPVLPVWPYDPRLFFTSPEGGSGKTRLNKSIAMMCPSPVSLVEASKASFVDFIGQQKTVIVTELDNWVGNGGRNRWLLGIGNAGYERGHSTSRKVGGKPVQTYLMCPMILDGLASVIHSTGMELRTFISRAIVVWVEKAPGDYRAPRISSDVQALGKWIRERLGTWMAQEVADGIGDDVPDMTGLPGNRPGALWEPLCMVADRAGGEWPEMIRNACLRLESPGGGNDAGAAERIQHGLAQLQAQLNGVPGGQGQEDDWGFAS